MNIKKIIEQTVCQILTEIKTSFRWEEFKNLSLNKKYFYAATNLKVLGKGSSRGVFLLSNRYVLKIALPMAKERGVAQNKAEVDIYTNPKTKPIVAKVYDFHPKYEWIVSEIVRPITSEAEFEKLSGVDIRDYEYYVGRISPPFTFEEAVEEDEEELKRSGLSPGRKEFLTRRIKTGKSKFMKAVAELIEDESMQLISADLSVLSEHWGKTADGRIVLLDYGYTEDVWKKHYI